MRRSIFTLVKMRRSMFLPYKLLQIPYCYATFPSVLLLCMAGYLDERVARTDCARMRARAKPNHEKSCTVPNVYILPT